MTKILGVLALIVAFSIVLGSIIFVFAQTAGLRDAVLATLFIVGITALLTTLIVFGVTALNS